MSLAHLYVSQEKTILYVVHYPSIKCIFLGADHPLIYIVRLFQISPHPSHLLTYLYPSLSLCTSKPAIYTCIYNGVLHQMEVSRQDHKSRERNENGQCIAESAPLS